MIVDCINALNIDRIIVEFINAFALKTLMFLHGIKCRPVQNDCEDTFFYRL